MLNDIQAAHAGFAEVLSVATGVGDVFGRNS